MPWRKRSSPLCHSSRAHRRLQETRSLPTQARGRSRRLDALCVLSSHHLAPGKRLRSAFLVPRADRPQSLQRVIIGWILLRPRLQPFARKRFASCARLQPVFVDTAVEDPTVSRPMPAPVAQTSLAVHPAFHRLGDPFPHRKPPMLPQPRDHASCGRLIGRKRTDLAGAASKSAGAKVHIADFTRSHHHQPPTSK